MAKMTFEGVIDFASEDDGTVLIARLDDGFQSKVGPERFAFVDVGFVDTDLSPKHEQAALFKGKKILVTVETLD